MPRLSFTLRDVFWLTLVVGMGVGWWVESRRSSQLRADARHDAVFLRAGEIEAGRWEKTLKKYGIRYPDAVFSPGPFVLRWKDGTELPHAADDPVKEPVGQN